MQEANNIYQELVRIKNGMPYGLEKCFITRYNEHKYGTASCDGCPIIEKIGKGCSSVLEYCETAWGDLETRDLDIEDARDVLVLLLYLLIGNGVLSLGVTEKELNMAKSMLVGLEYWLGLAAV